MRIKRICKVCPKEFFAIKSTQFFCSRKCFKKDYYVRLKTRQEIEKKNRKAPTYTCPHCSAENELEFDPIKRIDLYKAFICPFCGMPTAVVWAHRYDVTFQFNEPGRQRYIISSAIVSTQSLSKTYIGSQTSS